MSVKIQVKRSVAASWTSANPTLDSGEIGLETDTGYFKIGNGSTAWNSLSYTVSQSTNTSASPTFAGVTTTGNVIVGGNLTVNGNSTILNTETLTVEDNIIVLNSGVIGAPSINAGIEVERGSAVNVVMRWNESTDRWQVTENGTDYYDIINTNSLETRLADEHWHKSVRLATAAVLPNTPTYTAGTIDLDGGYGIGAKLESSANAQLSVDGTNAVVGNRILVKNQANQLHNGVYDVTAQGSASAHWILTRSADMDGSYADQIDKGETVGVQEGVDNYYQQFYVSSTGTGTDTAHIIGTDNITFVQFTGTQSFNAGNGLTVVGNTLNIVSEDNGRISVSASSVDLGLVAQNDTSSAAGLTFVSDVGRDAYGRVTGITTRDAQLTLGTNTTGDYVAALTAGTGISLANNSGEGAQPTISIGQSVATSASVTFANVTAPVTGNVTGDVTGSSGSTTGNAATATALQNARTISLSGDVSGSVSFNGSSDVTISATVQPNSVALGTDTTGNYMSDLTQGTGVTITHTPGEGSNATIAIGQSVATSASPTFAGLNLNGNIVFEGATADDFETIIAITDPTSDRVIVFPDLTGTVVTTGDTGSITSLMIADGAIVNADINSSAAIDKTKISGTAITAGDTGTVTSTMILDGTIVNADINSSAAISHSKLADATAGQVLLGTTTTGVVTATTISGDITIDGAGVALIAANSVALGTDTTGNYVATITGGTGVTSTAATTGEGTTHTLSVGQAVGTTDNVTFAGVTADAIKIGVTAAGEIDTTSGNLTIDSAGGTVTIDDNLTVTGDLTVSGTTTSINTETLTVDDNIIVLNNNVTGTPTDNAGIEIERGTSANVSVRWNETSDKWEVTNDGTNYGNIVTTGDSGTVTSTMITDGTIVDADINAAAAIALSKLATSTSGNIIVYNSSGVPTAVAETGDISISDTGVTAIAAGVIVNADVNASAAIDYSKLASLTSGNIIVGNVSNVATSTAVSGDITITNAGVTEIASGVIVNADVSTSASIAHSKLANAIDGQILLGTTTTGVVTATTVSGDVTITGGGVTAIASGVVVDGDVNASAAIAYSKLANITAGSILLGNASNIPTVTALSGDVTVNSSGVTAIGSGVIVDADISASAAIALTKLANITAGSVLIGNASNAPTATALSGDVTINSSGVTAIGSGVVVNADISATAAIELGKLADVSTTTASVSYTLLLTDKNKIVEISNASANTLTVPLNSSVAFPVGSQITFIQTGAGQTTITPAGGVGINGTPGLNLRAQWSSATLIKRATDTWVALGDLSA